MVSYKNLHFFFNNRKCCYLPKRSQVRTFLNGIALHSPYIWCGLNNAENNLEQAQWVLPVCVSLNWVQTAPVAATTVCLSAFPPLCCRLCFLQEWGEVGGDWWGETTGEVESGWWQKTNRHNQVKHRQYNICRWNNTGKLVLCRCRHEMFMQSVTEKFAFFTNELNGSEPNGEVWMIVMRNTVGSCKEESAAGNFI